MLKTNLISIHQVCKHYKVPEDFINALHEYELIEIIISKDENYLEVTQLKEFEKMIRLHYDLEINLQGIDAIYNLLKQVEEMQNEITNLNNKLRFYEDQ